MSDVKVNVNIDAADIEKQVVDAIVQSSIGDRIRKAIEAQAEKLRVDSYSYVSNEVEKVVKDAVRDYAHHLLSTDYRELLEAEVRKHLTKEKVENTLSDYFKHTLNRW